MTRFADPLATETLSLGACQCPGTPHGDGDEVVIRYQLGASALARIGRAELEGAVRLDPFAGYRQTVYEATESWNLEWLGEPDAEGNRQNVTVPISLAAIEHLDVDTLKTIAEAADKAIQSKGSLPNGRGAPSRASSRGSASRTRTTTRTPGT